MNRKNNDTAPAADTIYSRFSKTLAYNQTDTNIVSVHNWPHDRMTSTDHLLDALTLDDFYNSRNVPAFMTYTKSLAATADGEIGFAIVLGTQNGHSFQVKVMRPNLGKLMEVLFCFKFSGIPMGDNFDAVNSPDASLVSVSRLLTAYQTALDRDATDDTWEYLNTWTNVFYELCEKGLDPDCLSDYISNDLCVGRPKKS